jgi:indole-3-glycerol phosphate synthase/phosphoribosylanthranilate isomerase
MAEQDLDLACRKLIYGTHKVCGLTTAEQAQMASDFGSVFGVLIFAKKSPRCISLAQAHSIVKQVNSLQYVGVFVDEAVELVAEIVNQLALFAVQLHGNESADYIEALRKLISTDCQIWRAFSVSEQLTTFPIAADGYVLDGKSPGSGQTFNWQLINNDKQNLATTLLAGGISEDNIIDALSSQQTHNMRGLDLNSGVESQPGIKDKDKLTKVFAKIRCY